MTTGEHHLQLIVADLVIEIGPVGLRPTVCSTLEQQCDLVLLGAKILSASDDIERVIARYLREPGRRILRNSSEGPVPHCFEKCILHCVLGELQIFKP